MKQAILMLVVAGMLYSCNSSQSKAEEQAKLIQQAVKENSPGSIPTSAGGFYMKAKMDGKEWVASSMDIMDEEASKIVGNYNGEFISLPYYRNSIEVGHIINFNNSAVDLKLNDEVGLWGGHKGQMVITKVDETSAEGTFNFTASSDDGTKKTLEVTDGSFRILFSKKNK